jgi:predicted secreted protein
MAITTQAALYFVLWWVCFFIVLPLGNRRTQHDAGERLAGTDPGAPHQFRMVIKLAIVSVAAFVLLFVVNWALSLPALRDYWK